MRYSSLDSEYLAQLDDIVLIHTATQYHTALQQISEMEDADSAAIGLIRVSYQAVRLELERRGLQPGGWLQSNLDDPA